MCFHFFPLINVDCSLKSSVSYLQIITSAGVANAVVFVLDRPTVDAISYRTIKVSAYIKYLLKT